MSICVGAACKRSFTGLSSFDKHHETDYSRRPAVRCIDPATLGMVQQESGRWGFPITDAARDALRALRGRETPVHTSVTPQPSKPADLSYGAADDCLEAGPE